MAFNRKSLRLTLTLGNKNEVFTSDNKNKLSTVGLRISAEVIAGNGSVTPHARIKIYGLPQETMNKLIFLRWRDVSTLLNTVTLEAAEDGGDFSQVFKGGIIYALPDYSEAPNVSVTIESQLAAFESKNPSQAESFEGQYQVSDLIGRICQRIGFSFENNNVNSVIESPYLTGSDIDRIRWLCDNTNNNLYLGANSVAIAPKGSPRNVKIAVISPSTGLISYPVPNPQGVSFRCLYNPLIVFGGKVRIQDSSIELVNGEWFTFGIRTILETETESGRWFMEVLAQKTTDKNTYVAK